MKTVEFVIFIGIFNSGHFHFSASASASAEVDVDENAKADATANDSLANEENDPISVVLNKCDPDSFNSSLDVENFTSTFGIFDKSWIYNFSFVTSLKYEKNPCEKETDEIPLSTSEFWSFGFFNKAPNVFFNPENYCIKSMSEDVLNVEMCAKASKSKSNPKSYSDFPPTLQKCCGIEEILTIEKYHNASCEGSGKPPWKPESMEKKNIHPNYNSGGPPCDELQFILPYQLAPKIKRGKGSPITFKDIRVLENGQVETRESGNHDWKMLEQNIYCIDGYHNQLTWDKIMQDEPLDEIPALDESFLLLQCPPAESESGMIKDTIATVAYFISCVVLLLIVIIFGLVWKQQNIHGWTKGAFSWVMFLWFLFTGVRILYKEQDDFCVFVAVATHFFHLAAFSWMLLLNFDLWSTISSMTATNQRSNQWKRFLSYCAAAFAIPTFVVSISLIIEHQFSLFDTRVIRPQYGRTRCYLDHSAVRVYAVYPSLILFLPNFLFIFLTMKVVMDLKKGRKTLQAKNSKITTTQKKNNAEMFLCVKLFVIMGISWIFDIISGLADTDEVSWGWLVLDIYNICQPFLLFWLFVCTRTTREQLADKYSLFKAGFKWMDVHFPRLSIATGSGPGTEKSESRATKSSAFTTREEKSMHLSSFNSTEENRA